MELATLGVYHRIAGTVGTVDARRVPGKNHHHHHAMRDHHHHDQAPLWVPTEEAVAAAVGLLRAQLPPLRLMLQLV